MYQTSSYPSSASEQVLLAHASEQVLLAHIELTVAFISASTLRHCPARSPQLTLAAHAIAAAAIAAGGRCQRDAVHLTQLKLHSTMPQTGAKTGSEHRKAHSGCTPAMNSSRPLGAAAARCNESRYVWPLDSSRTFVRRQRWHQHQCQEYGSGSDCEQLIASTANSAKSDMHSMPRIFS